MKFKYFLRGLGIGILITASILTISFRMESKQQTLSNAQIIEKAEKLGMIMPEETSTPEPSSTPLPSESSNESSTPVPSVAPEESSTPTPSVAPEETITPAPSKKPEETKEPTPSKEPKVEETEKTSSQDSKEAEYVSVTIEKGMWSEEVANALKGAGIIKDAAKFNAYLTDNGYASSISVGTYQIAKGATYKEIAEKITKQ
ncbi:MAG: hypothetical protein PWP24_1072 [Clostridiales bacterium]|nr:hypothetical protein [Clostridiales bacterium]